MLICKIFDGWLDVAGDGLKYLKIGSATVRLGGMAKGSGMIHPNMATMLGVRSYHHDLCDYL